MSAPFPIRRVRGIVLATVLMLMTVMLLMGLAAARLAIHGQLAARFDGDRQAALAAAEAALADAERDIAGPDSVAPGRQSMFDIGEAAFSQHCGRGADDTGLCLAKPDGQVPDWQLTDLAQDDAATVAFGAYTGAQMETGGARLPRRLPRYLIELVPQGPTASGTLYRITAIGFGQREGTQVVLQTVYHRAAGPPASSAGMPAGRLAWREVANWPALHKLAVQ